MYIWPEARKTQPEVMAETYIIALYFLDCVRKLCRALFFHGDIYNSQIGHKDLAAVTGWMASDKFSLCTNSEWLVHEGPWEKALSARATPQAHEYLEYDYQVNTNSPSLQWM